MRYIKTIIALFGVCAILASCQPRIDFEEGQWGDQAFLEDVKVFIYKQEDHSLEEAENGGDDVTGVQRIFLSTSSDIDKNIATVSVSVPVDTDLANVGIVFRHTAKLIEPLNDAPKAGFLDDFSTGPYVYRVTSADGTTRDWTISFIVE